MFLIILQMFLDVLYLSLGAVSCCFGSFLLAQSICLSVDNTDS